MQHKHIASKTLVLVLAVLVKELVIHATLDSVLGAVNLLGNEVKVYGGSGTEVNLTDKAVFHFSMGFDYTILLATIVPD